MRLNQGIKNEMQSSMTDKRYTPLHSLSDRRYLLSLCREPIKMSSLLRIIRSKVDLLVDPKKIETEHVVDGFNIILLERLGEYYQHIFAP